MATNEKVIELSNRVKSIKSSSNPETNHIIAGADDIFDDAKGKKQSVINAENNIQLASHESRLNAYTEGKFVTVSNYSALPSTGAVDTVYRVSSWDGTANNGQGAVDVTKYSEYAWENGTYKFLDVKTQIGEVFDISEYNSGNAYTGLANALGNNGINVPPFIRRGGMSVKFKQIITPATYTVVKTEGATEQPTGTEIQNDPGIISGTYTAEELSVFTTLPATLNSSLTYYLAVTETVDEQEVTIYTTWIITLVQTSDHKYVQYRLMATAFSTTESDWQGVDDEPTSGSDNLVNSGGVFETLLNYAEFVQYNTDRETTRLSVPRAKRKNGRILCYIENNELIIEMFIGSTINDSSWKNGQNWISKEDDFKFVDGASVEIKQYNIQLKSVDKTINNIIVSRIAPYYSDENYYLVCKIDGTDAVALLTIGHNELTLTAGSKSIVICIDISSLENRVDIGKLFRYEYLELVKTINKLSLLETNVEALNSVTSQLTNKQVSLDVESGSYIKINGRVQPAEGYGHSQPIFLRKGQTIKTLLKGSTNCSTISLYNNGSYTSVFAGDTTTKEYEYTAVDDCYVVLSGTTDSLSESNTKIYGTSSIPELQDNIEEIKNKVNSLITENITLSVTDGEYVKTNGRIQPEEGYGHSQPILVRNGQTLKVTVRGSSNTAVLSEYNNGVYTSIASGDNTTKEYSHTTDHDCYIVISGTTRTLSDSAPVIIAEYNLVNIADYLNTKEGVYWNDSLKLCQNDNLELIDGTYGVSGAKYGITTKFPNFRIAVDFKIDTDVNTSHEDIEIAKIGNQSVNIVCGAPTLLQEQYSIDDFSYVQEIGYNSGFKVDNSTQIRSTQITKPLVGETALMIWLKGSTEPMSVSDVQSRSQWLENNQDYILRIENDTLSIERNGIGNDGETFNGGATSTIFTTSLKNGNDYKTIGALYTELVALDYIVVKLINSDIRKSCENLAQSGVVRMVGRYNQQLDPESSVTEYHFDSYPVPLRYKIDESWHVLEILSICGTVYLLVDGYQFVSVYSQNVTLGTSGISLRNLEVWDGFLGDDAIFNDSKTHYSSKRSPCLFALKGHVTYDTWEGSGVVPSSVDQSTSRLESMCDILKRHNYQVINFLDFSKCSSLMELSKYGNKVAMFCFDDLAFVSLYMNKNARAHVSRHGFPMNFAVIHSSLKESQDAIDAILPMRLNGWCCCTHSLNHLVPLPRKNSVNLYNELQTILDECETFNFISNILVYNNSGQWSNCYNMFKMCGYLAAIDSGGGATKLYHNQYNIPRYGITDDSRTLEQLENALVK